MRGAGYTGLALGQRANKPLLLLLALIKRLKTMYNLKICPQYTSKVRKIHIINTRKIYELGQPPPEYIDSFFAILHHTYSFIPLFETLPVIFDSLIGNLTLVATHNPTQVF